VISRTIRAIKCCFLAFIGSAGPLGLLRAFPFLFSLILVGEGGILLFFFPAVELTRLSFFKLLAFSPLLSRLLSCAFQVAPDQFNRRRAVFRFSLPRRTCRYGFAAFATVSLSGPPLKIPAIIELLVGKCPSVGIPMQILSPSASSVVQLLPSTTSLKTLGSVKLAQ